MTAGTSPEPADLATERNGPAHDLPFRAAPPLLRYLVASTPRSGSTWLCRGLAATGLAGLPREYLHPMHRADFAKRWGPQSLADYLTTLQRHRTGANGAFGLKAHFFQLKALRDQGEPDLLELLPDLKILRIHRQDRLRQAVSFWRAQQSGAWTSDRAVVAAPRYDAGGIARALAQIERDAARWDRWLAKRNLQALALGYENLQADYAGSLAGALAHLGIDANGLRFEPPDLARQSDALNEEWLQRFRRERGD